FQRLFIKDMGTKNVTELTEFVLTGLTYPPAWQIPLFLLFLMLYLVTIMGNLGLITLIYNDPHLHIPMYLFLANLAFVDTWLSSTVTPKMLVNIITKDKMISLHECVVQFFSFGVSGTTECFLLATMAYDRYVAICNPLLYPVIMTNRQCLRMLVSSFVGGLSHVFTILIVLVSYTRVLFTILKKRSVQGIRKAFSTCGAHLLSVSLYYGSLLFMYVRPGSAQADDQDIIDSLFYTVIIPFLNPIIYSLRNKKVMDSMRKKTNLYRLHLVMCRLVLNIFFHHNCPVTLMTSNVSAS
uniref:G-protein coupled receptors family 1 profile domain-containing protein n=1 Tax=Sus scrofa TaxID=9823 RepID=A0A287A9T1_PIG